MAPVSKFSDSDLFGTKTFYASMLAGNPVFVDASFDLIETTVLSGSASSITFSNLNTYASTYKHLQVRMALTSSADSSIKFQFNADTTGNYALHALDGRGSNPVVSFGEVNQAAGYIGYTFSSVFGAVLEILDPFETTKNKTTRTLSGTASTSFRVYLASSHWRSTNSVTSIRIYNESGNFLTGSRFSLYGVR